ncbi:MAG: hypothetical protein HGA84_09580 [Syntrophobacteraceae bacterium]|nr:hypothetical protein [Syntrophobacteraceae bacterium]
MLMDADGNVSRAYKTVSIPMQILIDQKGIIRHVDVHDINEPPGIEKLDAEPEKLQK